MGRGNLRMDQGDFTAARDLFKELAAQSRGKPAASGALQAWAAAEIALGNIKAVDSIIKRLTKEHGEDPNAAINVHMNVANKLIGDRQFSQADQRLDRVIEEYAGLPQTAWVMHAKAQSALAQRRFGVATDIFDRIKKEFSGNLTAVIDADLGMADLVRTQGNADEALAMYQEVANKYPKYSQAIRALQAMADIYGEKRLPAQQQKAYERLIEEHAGDRGTLLNARLALANLYKARHRFPEALEQYKLIYENHPTADQAAWAKTSAARIYFEIGQEKLAETLLTELLAAFPADHEAAAGAKQFLDEIYQRD